MSQESARVIQVIELRFKRGRGVDMADPVRIVTQYRTLEGELLAEVDPSVSPTRER